MPNARVKKPGALFAHTSWWFIALVSLLGAPGCEPAAAVAEQKAAKPTVAVKSAEVAAIQVPTKLRLTGSLRGSKETDLAANVAGRVLSTRVERGQVVAKGELLAEVDVRAAALALNEARIQVETSRTRTEINRVDCDRFEQLRRGGAVSEFEYDQVMAKCKTAPLDVEAARARQSIAAKNVGDGAIRSPFAGVVSERFVEVGEYVQAPSRVVSLAEVDELRLEFSLPEQHFPDVKVGTQVDFRVAAYGDRVFSGRVAHVAGAVRETRDVMVEALVKNGDRKLLPGMFAEVDLVIGHEKLLSVPKSAVFSENGKLNVFVVKNGMLEQRVLQPASEVGDRLSVHDGLGPGERVVVADVHRLENGQSVR